MPANLTPDYKKADQWYRSASTEEEKLSALEEMLRVIPKHKGTEGLQADIKRKMSKLKVSIESGGSKKGAVKHADIFHIPSSGAGQVVLLGMPNVGKSSFLAELTHAQVQVADYPFTTDKPTPGMMKHEDVPIQIVDTPPITADFAPTGLVNALRCADIIAIVVDLSGDAVEQMDVCVRYLDSHKLLMPQNIDKDAEWVHLARPVIVLANKSDLVVPGTLDTLKELIERPFEYIEVSCKTAAGLNDFTRRCFEILDVVRVYAKRPGKEADMKEPFTLPRGSTVQDLAYLVHRQLAESLKFARAWHSAIVHDGQSVPRDHELTDKEIVELHFT